MTDSLTIVVAPGSATVREHIAAWTAARLLRRSVWIDPAALAEPVSDLVDLTVSDIDQKLVETTLRAVLGDAELDLVRVVLIRGPVDHDAASDPCLLDAADRTWEFAGRLRSVLATTTQLRRLNVIVPSGPKIDARLIDPRSDLNVVVSPEDRPSDGAVDHGVARPEIHPAHAAFACATIGALWMDTDTGAFDRQAGAAAEQPGRTVVVRSTARVVDVGGLPTKIIGRLLAGGSRSLRQYLPPSSNRTANSAALVKEVFEAFVPVERKTLYYRPPDPPSEAEPPRIVAMTFVMLMRFLRQVLRLRVLEWQQESRNELDEAVKKWLYRVTDRGTGDLPEYGAPTVDEMSMAAAQAPVDERTSALLPGAAPVTPFLWPLVRQLCFGLIDGGPMPRDVATRFNTLRPVLTDPNTIVAEPQRRFVLTDVELKVLHYRKLSQSQLRVMDNSTMDRLDQVLSQALADENPPGAGSGITGRQARRVLADCLLRLRTWRDEVKQDSSLMGRLLKHVHDEMTRAKDALLERRAEYELEERQRANVLHQLEEIRAQLTKFALFLLVPLMLAIATGIGWLTGGPGGLGRAMGIIAICALVFFGIGMVALSLTAERAALLDHELDRIEARRQHTVALVVQWPGEAHRLSSLYGVLLDWAEAIGWLLHQPFRRETDHPFGAQHEDLPRPEAFHLVEPAGDLDDLVREVAPQVFTEGWMTRLYDLVLDSAIPERTRENHQPDERTDPDRAPGPVIKEIEEDAPAPDPAAEAEPGEPDDYEPVWHARDRLLRALRNDREDATVSRYLRSAVWRTLCRLPPDRLTSLITVNPLDGNGIAHEVNALDFMRRGLPPRTPDGVEATLAPAAFSDTGMMQGRPKVHRVNLWGITSPLGFAEADRAAEPGEQVIAAWPPSADTTSEAYQVALIRLDVSGDCDREDLALTDLPAPETEPLEPIAD